MERTTPGEMDIEEALLARADELMTAAPGRVQVARISRIEDVRLLRTAREALTNEETAMLDRWRLALLQRLDGVQAAASTTAAKEGWLGRMLTRFRSAGLSNLASTTGFDGLAKETTQLERLPPPIELLDAAEAWAISRLVANRVDGDLDVLRSPWLSAHLLPGT